MSAATPCVIIDIPCYSDVDAAGSPEFFRIPLTAEVLAEIIGLQEYFGEANAALGRKFPGKSLSYLDLPFGHFTGEMADDEGWEDDSDTAGVRLEGFTLRVRKDCVYLIATVAVIKADVTSDRISNEMLNGKFAQLRQELLAAAAESSVVDALGHDDSNAAPVRKSSLAPSL
jgi:hypothetical protein